MADTKLFLDVFELVYIQYNGRTRSHSLEESWIHEHEHGFVQELKYLNMFILTFLTGKMMINNGICRVPVWTNKSPIPDFQISNTARPEWSKPRRRGRSDVVRVQAKLKAGNQFWAANIGDNDVIDVPSGYLT